MSPDEFADSDHEVIDALPHFPKLCTRLAGHFIQSLIGVPKALIGFPKALIRLTKLFSNLIETSTGLGCQFSNQFLERQLIFRQDLHDLFQAV